MTKAEKIALAARLLEVPADKLEHCCAPVPGLPALYFSVPEKGGGSLIIGDDGGVLYADSSVGYSRHLEAYRQGIRTPLEENV